MCTQFHDFGNTCTLKFMRIYICDNMKISIADKRLFSTLNYAVYGKDQSSYGNSDYDLVIYTK